VVKGLNRFRTHFEAFTHNFVLIGGTACDLAFTQSGIPFRATKDLDIVLCLESLDARFAAAFWDFVALGRYDVQESTTGQKRFYRFKKPKNPEVPAMLELFARAPDVLGERPGTTLVPIPIDEEVSSLSAILLDNDYYAWIHSGKRLIDGLPVVRPEHLIPLKTRAWLDLRDRAAAGQSIDSNDIKKHRNDFFRLYRIIEPDFRAALPQPVMLDMQTFLAEVLKDPPDLKSLDLRSLSMEDVLDSLRALYAIPAT